MKNFFLFPIELLKFKKSLTDNHSLNNRKKKKKKKKRERERTTIQRQTSTRIEQSPVRLSNRFRWTRRERGLINVEPITVFRSAGKAIDACIVVHAN